MKTLDPLLAMSVAALFGGVITYATFRGQQYVHGSAKNEPSVIEYKLKCHKTGPTIEFRNGITWEEAHVPPGAACRFLPDLFGGGWTTECKVQKCEVVAEEK